MALANYSLVSILQQLLTFSRTSNTQNDGHSYQQETAADIGSCTQTQHSYINTEDFSAKNKDLILSSTLMASYLRLDQFFIPSLITMTKNYHTHTHTRAHARTHTHTHTHTQGFGMVVVFFFWCDATKASNITVFITPLK